MRPAKAQISLGIRPVWSVSSLCAQWVAKDPSFLHADRKGWVHWAHMPFCWFSHEAAEMLNFKIDVSDVSLVTRYGADMILCLIRVILLAHLSRRLTRWAYSIAMVPRPSVVVVVHTFKPVYLWSQLANLDQILCVASLEWGKGCIRFWGRLDQNSGFHGNRKPPLSYNGKNNVSTFSRFFLIGSFLYLQVTRTCIKSRTSSNFHQIRPLTRS